MTTDHSTFDSTVRYAITAYIAEHGMAPTVADLARQRGCPEANVQAAYQRLADSHGLVLHPNSDRIWVAHPFSLAPTSFWVTSERGSWWGNCAWCALGIAAMLHEDTRIVTRLGAQDESLEVRIENGAVSPMDVVLHIALPVAQWWNNVLYTCGTILFFRSEADVETWCRDRGIAQGAILTMHQAWNLAQAWYGDYLSPAWRRHTAHEAQTIFTHLGLTGPFWHLHSDWT